MTPDSTKPLPVPDESSEGYWNAAAAGVLALPRCQVCEHFALPPTTVCPNCGSTDPRFVATPVDGSGAIRSWTVVRDSFLPGFADDVPYVLIDVELDAEPELRMIGRLVDGPDVDLRLDDRVIVTFDRLSADVAVPAFAMARR